MAPDDRSLRDPHAPEDLEDFQELAESECWALLRAATVGRLAIPTADRGVDIFPVNHLVDQGTLVFRTAAGAKLDGITAADEVAFEADNADAPAGVAWSVVVRGHAELVTAATDLFETFDLKLRPWHASHKPYFVRVMPRFTSGRRFIVDPRARE